MDDMEAMEEEITLRETASVVGMLALNLAMKHRQRPRRRIWCHSWLLNRPVSGFFHTTLSELQQADSTRYANFLRMDADSFNELLTLVQPDISKQDTAMRVSISAAQRLVITLRFLATGETFKSLQYLFRVSDAAIGQIVPETCRAIYSRLRETHLKVCRLLMHSIGMTDFDYSNIAPFISSDSMTFIFSSGRSSGRSSERSLCDRQGDRKGELRIAHSSYRAV